MKVNFQRIHHTNQVVHTQPQKQQVIISFLFWNKTFKMPTIIANCSNNYGPKQFPEKLIPLTILKIIPMHLYLFMEMVKISGIGYLLKTI